MYVRSKQYLQIWMDTFKGEISTTEKKETGIRRYKGICFETSIQRNSLMTKKTQRYTDEQTTHRTYKINRVLKRKNKYTGKYRGVKRKGSTHIDKQLDTSFHSSNLMKLK